MYELFIALIIYPNDLNEKTQLIDIKLIALYKCRDDWIRTSDLVVPNDARYRAALHPALF